MAKIVKRYDCGIVSDSFKPEDLAKKINKLSISDIVKYKNNAAKAVEELNTEKNSDIL